jgi:hypothetical protein
MIAGLSRYSARTWLDVSAQFPAVEMSVEAPATPQWLTDAAAGNAHSSKYLLDGVHSGVFRNSRCPDPGQNK